MPSFRQQPLIYRMAGQFRPSPALQYEEAFARIIREMRRYSATSIVEAALRILWADYPTKHDALQIAPWHVMLLVKWAMRDPYVALSTGPSIPVEAFDTLRQRALDLVGLEHRRNPPENVFLMMRAHLQQVDFQRPEGWGFLRWPALIAREATSQPSHRQFRSQLGLSPDNFMDLSFGLFAAVLTRELPLASGWFDLVRDAYGSSIDAMWNLVSRDLPALRDEVRRSEAKRLPMKQELYEFPYLKRFPFVRMRDGRSYCWHPMVFARGLEDLVHLKLSGLQNDYTEPFSRLFERYVTELTRSMAPNTLDEDAYRELAGKDASAVEAAVACGDCNVFVEAKMSLFSDDVVLTDNETQAFQKTKRIRDGIKQAWSVGKAVRSYSSVSPDLSKATQDFLLLVTSRELFVGGGEMLLRLYRRGDFDYPDDTAKQNMPLHNVFVLSIENFERLSCAVASGAVRLPDLVKEAAAKNQDPATSAILFDAFIERYVSNWGLPDLISSARRESEARIRSAFGETPVEP
jgi:hypothetical protein